MHAGESLINTTLFAPKIPRGTLTFLWAQAESRQISFLLSMYSDPNLVLNSNRIFLWKQITFHKGKVFLFKTVRDTFFLWGRNRNIRNKTLQNANKRTFSHSTDVVAGIHIQRPDSSSSRRWFLFSFRVIFEVEVWIRKLKFQFGHLRNHFGRCIATPL